MTTLEKKFVQIFERKDWIIEQVQRQVDSYTEQLASRLLIDGITPPPCLLNPRINPHPSDLHELKKEEIISKLLLPPTRESASHSNAGCSLYYRHPGGNGQLSKEMSMEDHAPNKVLNVNNGQSMTLVRPNDDRGCSLNRVTEQDDSVNSPQYETDARISSIYAAPDASLARIQRSRSRQKARELRSDVKTSAKSLLSDENRAHISFTGDTISKSDFHQITQDNCASELGKCKDITGANSVAAEGKGDCGNGRTSYSGRLARSSSSKEKPSFLNDHSKTSLSSDKEELDGSILVQPICNSLQQSGHDKVDFPDISFGSYAAKKSASGKIDDAQRQSKVYSGRITRSKGSSQQTSGSNKSLELGTSASYNLKGGSGALPRFVGDLMHELNASNKLLDAVETSVGDRIKETETICSNKGVKKPVISSNIPASRVTRSRSVSTNGADGKENAEIVAGNGPIEASFEMQPANFGIKPNKQSSDCCKIVKPKQLNFDEINSPHSNKRKLDELLGQECNPSNDSPSIDDKLPVESVLSSNSKAARTRSHDSFDECAQDGTVNIGLEMIENPVTEDVGHTSKVSLHDAAAVLCEVSKSPKEIDNNCVSKDAKQGDKDSEDKEVRISEEDIGCLKSKEFEDGTISNMSNGRITRSRDSSQQTSGTNKSLKLGTSASYNSKEGSGAHPHSVGDFMHKLNASNKLSDAVETSQGLCSNKDVMKPVISSNIPASRVTRFRSGSMKESSHAEIVAGNGPMDAPVAMQPANSGVKLDNVTVCMESEAFALKQSSDSCKIAKPKQPNFDENNSSHSNKRKLDGLLGQECYPSNDDKLRMESVLTSNSKAARTYSHDSFDQCAQDGTMNIGFEMIENPVEEDVEHTSKVSLHDDAAVKEIHNNSVSNDTKQGDKDFEGKDVRISEEDIDCSKSKEFEDGTHSNMSNVKLNSAKFNTWPRDQERDVEGQRTCFSDSRRFRVHIQGDAIQCELESSEKDDIQRHDGMTCDLPEGTESLHELDAAEAISTEVDADTLNLIKSAADDSTYVRAEDETKNDAVYRSSPERVSYLGGDGYESVWSPQNDDDRMENVNSGINFETLGIERASIVEQICKSASMLTPLSEFSSTYKQHQVEKLYGLLEHMDKGNSVSLDEDFRGHLPPSDCDIPEVDYSFPKKQTFDSSPFSGTPFTWQSKTHYSSPVGKLRERSGSSSGSSGKRLSSNPELTCFPIVEDPDTNEESENAEDASDELQENIRSEEEMVIITENDCEVAVEIEAANEFAERMRYRDRCSSNSEVNIPRTYDKAKYKSKFHPGMKSNKYEEENRYSSASTRASIRRNASFQTDNSKNKSSMRSRIQRPSQKEGKLRSNIVSNITSFVPIVQQKQAAAVCPVKRDVKVKALEAAEAAKRREEEKEKERKMKKEALKVERARVEKENAREMELNKKKKQEEQKKKEADMAARKRQREEDERKQMARKRKFAESRKEQKVQSEKSRGGKTDLEKRNGKHVGVSSNNNKGSSNTTEKLRQNACETLPSVVQSVLENFGSGDKEKAWSIVENSPGEVGLRNEENSYEISPYQCSDDEDEYEDDLPTDKFVPSWASKSAVGMVLPLQQKLDPEKIFSIESFCSMDEVLPWTRRLQ